MAVFAAVTRYDGNIKEVMAVLILPIVREYYQVEQIQLADGKSLNLSQLDKLIEAMAGFEREHSGDITRMPSNEVQTYLDKIAVSSYWG